MTILCVDDDPVSLHLLLLTLEHHQFSVAGASSAAAALEWLERAAPVELVITDQKLGGMTGLQLFSQMRGDPRWSSLPVILCTGAADRDTVEEAVRRGVRHFIVKPVNPGLLIEKVATAFADRPPVLRHRDEATVRLRLSEGEYTALAETTREHLGVLRAQLEAAWMASDLAAARHAALLISEPAGLLGAPRCLAAIADLQEATDDIRARLLVDVVVREVAALDAALGRMLRPDLVEHRDNLPYGGAAWRVGAA